MASLIPQDKQAPVLLIGLAIAVAYVGYTGTGLDMLGLRGVKQTKDSIVARQKTLDSLVTLTDSAKRLLASGSVEDLRRRLEGYRTSLELMRRLVPDRNEVANLMDEISTRAKIRGVQVSQFQPLPPEPGPAPFETYKYQYSVMGRYDQLGEFLSDVASLQRIIVPMDLSLAAADLTRAKALGDSSGALLEARFQIRTFVKTATAPEGQASGS
jgi:Tfp pilus assembly protein PilO